MEGMRREHWERGGREGMVFGLGAVENEEGFGCDGE
jgi:hypothetical protein